MKTTPEELAELGAQPHPTIPLKDGRALKWREIGYLKGYALHQHNGALCRFLDEFESDFVESAIAVSATLIADLEEAGAKITQLEIAAVNRSVSNKEASALFALAESAGELATVGIQLNYWRDRCTTEEAKVDALNTLLAAKEQETIERCIKICDAGPERQNGNGPWVKDQEACVQAIRALLSEEQK